MNYLMYQKEAGRDYVSLQVGYFWWGTVDCMGNLLASSAKNQIVRTEPQRIY